MRGTRLGGGATPSPTHPALVTKAARGRRAASGGAGWVGGAGLFGGVCEQRVARGGVGAREVIEARAGSVGAARAVGRRVGGGGAAPPVLPRRVGEDGAGRTAEAALTVIEPAVGRG